MEKNSVVELESPTRNSTIYYTLDGSAPELHKVLVKVSKHSVLWQTCEKKVSILILYGVL